MKTISLCFAFVVSLVLVTSSAADIINVPADQPTIQAGIDAASDGDEVVVASGSYNEAINFLGKAIILRSSDGADLTTIDGTSLNNSVVKCISGEGLDTVLDGFTITGAAALSGGGMRNEGSSPTVMHCIFADNDSDRGGGIYNVNAASPTITDCSFESNTSTFGGAIFNDFNASPMISNCSFITNVATARGGAIYNGNVSQPTIIDCMFDTNTTNGNGGALYNDNSSPTVTRCSFIANTANTLGGGTCNFFGSSPLISNCSYAGNTATFGGAIFNDFNSSPTIASCVINGNHAASHGGGVYNGNESIPMMRNCSFIGNHADDRGGGVYNDHSNPVLVNCTVTANSSANGGGGMFSVLSEPVVSNSIIWGNEPQQIVGAASISFSDVEGGADGDGNINTDPMFVDAGGGDIHLTSSSACINAGDDLVVEKGSVDFEGDPRLQQCRVDMGADETPYFVDCNTNDLSDACEVDQGTAPDENGNGIPDECDCPADLNGDDTVGAADLAILLGNWGPCADPGDCPGDIAGDGDGLVGADDLATLLGAWGPCE